MPGPERIEVDLTAIEHNVEVIRRVLRRAACPTDAPPGICAILKSDAYALGAARIAKRLSLLGIEMIGVFTPNQARELVDAALTTPILILMPVRSLERNDALYRAAWRRLLHFSVHDHDNLRAMSAIADRLGISLPVHLAVDTGMSREGAPLEEAATLLEGIGAHRRLELAGIYTHFASADRDPDHCRAQHEAFQAWLERNEHLIPETCLIHSANTFGMLRSGAYHRSMVRVGLALLGYASEEFDDESGFDFADEARELRPCFRWLSRVIMVKDVKAGTRVGYGGTWTADRDSTLGVVPVGYADGYPLALSNKAEVGVELLDKSRRYVPVRGRVSMDQVVIDLTDIPRDEATVGLPVEMVSASAGAPNHLPRLARLAGTITHEMLLRISPRVPRSYLALEEARVSDREAMRLASVRSAG